MGRAREGLTIKAQRLIMIDPNKKEPLPINSNEVCHSAFELIGEKRYDEAEQLLTINMSRTDDDTSIALYHSVLGVISKIRGEYKTAWRHYERAEKLMPEDPAIKTIIARLLISQFSECSQAIKKAKKVLVVAKGNPVFAHQAYTTMGLAYCKQGERTKALDMLQMSWGDDFTGFVTAENIDFELLEIILRREWGEDLCKMFLLKALDFAKNTNEEDYIKLFEKMLDVFNIDYPSNEKNLS